MNIHKLFCFTVPTTGGLTLRLSLIACVGTADASIARVAVELNP
jgi:hypothetical protein